MWSWRRAVGIRKCYVPTQLPDSAAFVAAVEDIRTLMAGCGPCCRPGRQATGTVPVLEDDLIAFNGVNLNCVCPLGVPQDSTSRAALDGPEFVQIRGRQLEVSLVDTRVRQTYSQNS